MMQLTYGITSIEVISELKTQFNNTFRLHSSPVTCLAAKMAEQNSEDPKISPTIQPTGLLQSVLAHLYFAKCC